MKGVSPPLTTQLWKRSNDLLRENTIDAKMAVSTPRLTIQSHILSEIRSWKSVLTSVTIFHINLGNKHHRIFLNRPSLHSFPRCLSCKNLAVPTDGDRAEGGGAGCARRQTEPRHRSFLRHERMATSSTRRWMRWRRRPLESDDGQRKWRRESGLRDGSWCVRQTFREDGGLCCVARCLPFQDRRGMPSPSLGCAGLLNLLVGDQESTERLANEVPILDTKGLLRSSLLDIPSGISGGLQQCSLRAMSVAGLVMVLDGIALSSKSSSTLKKASADRAVE